MSSQSPSRPTPVGASPMPMPATPPSGTPSGTPPSPMSNLSYNNYSTPTTPMGMGMGHTMSTASPANASVMANLMSNPYNSLGATPPRMQLIQQQAQLEQQMVSINQQILQLTVQKDQIWTHMKSKGYTDVQVNEYVVQRQTALMAQQEQIKARQRELGTYFIIVIHY